MSTAAEIQLRYRQQVARLEPHRRRFAEELYDRQLAAWMIFLRHRIDEEGCGAVFGAVNLVLWERDDA